MKTGVTSKARLAKAGLKGNNLQGRLWVQNNSTGYRVRPRPLTMLVPVPCSYPQHTQTHTQTPSSLACTELAFH